MKNRSAVTLKALFAGAVVAAVASPTFAAGETFDTSSSLAWIAAGVVAAGLVATAMLGLVALVGAAKKAQRAGT